MLIFYSRQVIYYDSRVRLPSQNPQTSHIIWEYIILSLDYYIIPNRHLSFKINYNINQILGFTSASTVKAELKSEGLGF